jgi:DNA-binding CsgD family transcriptional regulator
MAENLTDRLEMLRHLLSEREKELDGIYELASLLAQPGYRPDELLAATAAILRRSMQYPELALVKIWNEEVGTGSQSPDDLVASYLVEKTFSINKTVTVLVGYRRGSATLSEEPAIVDREERLVTSTATLLSEVLERMEMENVLRESTKVLQHQAGELEQKNAALREILSHIEYEKNRSVRDARAHVSMFIEPYLHRLRASSDLKPDERACVEQLERSFRDLFTQEADRVVRLADRLSPRELEICDLVRNGLTTKQISSFVHITEATVERHRNTIRKKLNLTGRKVNLTSYLRRHE